MTGGARGQKLPKAVREALDEIQSQRGPRGRFKEAAERLSEINVEAVELENKAKSVSELLTNLARNRRDLKDAHTDWDEATHRNELEVERNKRVTAVTLAAEIARSRDAAKLATERATNARHMLEYRTNAIGELAELELELTALGTDIASAHIEKDKAKDTLEVAERNLIDLRTQANKNTVSIRMLDRIRTAVGLNTEIQLHQTTLNKAVTLGDEAIKLSEFVGSIAVSDEAVARIEEAMTENSAADAAG